MAANRKRLVELSMVPPLATELANQIDGITTKSAVRLQEMSMPTGLSREVLRQMLAGVGNAQKLADLGMPTALAAQVAVDVSGGGAPLLGPLTLNGSLMQGVAASGVTITGALLDETITLGGANAGLTVQGPGTTTRTVTGTPSAFGALTATQTSPTASNSPRGPNTIGTVAAVLPTLVTGGTAYQSFFSAERLVSGSTDPLIQLASGPTQLGGSGAQRVTPADIAGVAGAGVPTNVSAIYDQVGGIAGGRQQVQATAGNQPRVNSTNLLNGTVPILYWGTSFQSGSVASTAGTASLVKNNNTQIFVFQPNQTIEQACFSQTATGGGADVMSMFTAPIDNGTFGSDGATRNFFVPSSPIVFIYCSDPTNARWYLNGTKTEVSPAVAGTTGIGQVVLGRILGSTSYNANYRLAAYGNISGLINDTDAANITAAMMSRFGLGDGSYAKNIVAIGDSILEGSSVTTFAQMSCGNLSYVIPPLLNTTHRLYNLGVGGKKMQTMFNDRAKFEGKLFASGKINIAIIQAGLNDLAGASPITGSALYALLVTYIQYLKGLGFKVLVCSLLPASSNSMVTNKATVRAETLNYHALLYANGGGGLGASGQWDGLIDLAANATIGTYPTSSDNTALYSDQIHPTDANYVIQAPIYAAAINAITS